MIEEIAQDPHVQSGMDLAFPLGAKPSIEGFLLVNDLIGSKYEFPLEDKSLLFRTLRERQLEARWSSFADG